MWFWTLLACAPDAPAPPVAPAPVVPTMEAPAPPPPASQPSPRFQGQVSPIPEAVRAEMIGVSWREGCPVPLHELALVRASHWDLTGAVQEGEIVVAQAHGEPILGVLRSLFEAGFPIARLERVDAFGGSDDASMDANNTSGFNCRPVTGGAGWSRHSYGDAIDLNPVQNPYVRGGRVLPPAGQAFLTRTPGVPGLVVEGDAAVRAFEAIGWRWGGRWTDYKDYQHFSATGR